MKLKICGMRDNIEEVAALHPDFLGFIFWEPSSRYFSGTLPDSIPDTVKKIGVFVNQDVKEVLYLTTQYKLQGIQLHGNESPDYCQMLRTELSRNGLEETLLIKAFALHPDFNFEVLLPYEKVVDYYLFDSKGELPGGNGFTFDWIILNKYTSSKPFFLSGGIGPEQVDQIRDFRASEASEYCIAVDVNSRFETRPGFKDIASIKEFIMIEGIGLKKTKDIGNE